MTELKARRRLANSIQYLIKVHMKWTDKKAAEWMESPSQIFGLSAPVDLVMNGRSYKVLAFIEAAIVGDGP